MSECKRCGDEENRIDGFCSIYCRDLHAAEAEPPPPTKAIVLEGEVVLIEPDPDSTTQFTAFKTLMDIDPLPDDALVGRVKVTIEPLEGEGNE